MSMGDLNVLHSALIFNPSTPFLYGGGPRFLGMDIFSLEMGRNFRIIDVYLPDHSRLELWNHLLQLSLMNSNDIILCGQLNFTICH